MEPSRELRDVIVAWFEAAQDGDASWRDRHVSRHARLRIVGTDPAEWLQGEAAYAFLEEEAESVGGKLKVVVNECEAFSEGSVGWGVALPTITIPAGRQVSPPEAPSFTTRTGTRSSSSCTPRSAWATSRRLGMCFRRSRGTKTGLCVADLRLGLTDLLRDDSLLKAVQ